ncbi:MAG: penicillin-binding protein 2 [Richelia sp. RM2_1_2]|nr:penicillin-binding protein 2 [Richelia sp. SM1_7_0]NJN11951.1 penicillin-binding protein 2 [Richelia sp. RM1_1_1]NJO30328.1 penicillin-binding protein 2 [Richelia sp. SL_2_1]NJO62849.1 penicillin-binding protein 2 [Richelia sp. RM2_1_2]
MTLLQLPRIGKEKDARTVGKGYQSIFLIVFTLLLTSGILSRLAYLQVVKGESFKKRAQENRIRLILRQPERGNIYDRNGKLLATTRYPHSVYLWPMAHKKEETWNTMGPRLSQILGIPQKEIEEKLTEAGPNSSSLVRIARDISLGQITALKEYESDLPGVEINREAIRYYPHGAQLAHVIGYTRELTAEQLAEKKKDGYRLGDVIGQMGVEKAFETTLRGEWGGQQVEVDGKGRPLRTLGVKQAKPGQDIKLTIDIDLQKAAYKALQGQTGTVIAMHPENGGILAMVSNPAFDPNVFSKQKPSPKELEAILLGKNHPMLNRAFRAYPPASTFKVVTIAAGLESGKFAPNTVLQTYGSLSFGGHRFNEWNHAGFGPLGFTGALAMSSDTFFYQVGARVGGTNLVKWTKKFGFGVQTGSEFSFNESRGFVPDNAYQRKLWKRDWTVGDSVNMSIGQGALLTTPLQVTRMFAIPANGGYLVKPHILKDNEEKKKWRESVGMKPKTVEIIRKGLREVITNGTAKSMNSPTIPPMAGKTGTAEAWRSNRVKANHAWFGGYAPADKPEIVVLAFGEHSGAGGGAVAAPMVKQVMEDYFQRKYPGKYQKPEAKEKKAQ